MKNVKNWIKGILLTTLFVGLFNLNTSQIQSTEVHHPNEVSVTQVEDNIFINSAFADHEPNHNEEEDEGEDKKAVSKINIKDVLETVAKASTYVNNIFNPLIYFFSFNIGNFLGNDYIYGSGMGEMLQNIWVVSRNIVNIIFVFILLFLAVKHIFSSDESTDLKKVLPKFALMLIAVNFSWLGAKVVLDTANVATNVVFAIPRGVQGLPEAGPLNTTLGGEDGKNKCQYSEDQSRVKGLCQPEQIWFPADAQETIHFLDCDDEMKKDFQKDYDETYPANKKANPEGLVYQEAAICWKQMDIGSYNQNNASYFLSFSMARVQNLTRATTQDSVGHLAIGTLFALIIQVVYLVAFGSLYVALILRVAALWFLVAFSPFLVLIYFLTKDLQFQAGGVEEQFSIQAFISWAFAPAKVGAVWTVGFLMVTAGQSVTEGFFDTLNQSGEVTSSVFSVTTLFLGMDTLQQFIWLLMTTAIIWVGTFAVLTKLKFGQRFFNAINDYGTRFATEVAKSPRWAPIMPVYDHKTKEWSMGSLGQVAGPMGLIESAKSKYTQPSRADAFMKAERALKSHVGQNDFNAMAESPDKAFKHWNKITNMSAADTAADPKKVRDVIESSGQFGDNAGTVAENVIAGARKAKGTDTASQVSAPVPASAQQAANKDAMRQAFRDALQNAEQKTKITNQGFTEKQVQDKAEKEGLDQRLAPGKAIDEALRLLADEAQKTPAGTKPPAGNSTPQPQPGGGGGGTGGGASG